MEKSIGDEGHKTGLREQIRQLKADIARERLDLHKLLVGRPQVWPNCMAQVNKATGAIVAAIDFPIPHGITANSTLYAFEEPTAQSPARYLGEFNVTKVEDKQILLQSAYPLSQLDMKKLGEAIGPWSFYNLLPQDNHETFAQLTDEQKKAVLPEATLAEYQKDGKPANAQGANKYVRQLRDYSQLLNHARRRLTILFDESEAMNRDKALVEESLADAGRQVQFAQNLITELKSLLAKKEKERDDVAKFSKDKDGKDRLEGGILKLLQDKLALIEGMVNRQIEENKAMAGQIAQKQLEATRQIDARTRAMAQSAASGEK